MKLVEHLINGELVSMGDPTQDVFNPSTGEVSKQVEVASKNTVEKAITAAQEAFPAWRSTPPLKRSRIMFRFKELLEKNINKIAQLIGEEHGKIAHDALGEITRGIENVEYACYAPELLKGEHSKNISTNIDSWSEFQPLGVVAGITPFNFPAMVPLWMYPMAIVCGNCFVLKPSERDPSAALFIAQLFYEAGLPKGVLNVVNGGKEAVDTLLKDERVQAVSFVGSTAIAKYIYKTASENDKRCQALGGAKNHAIVMQDAEMENTVNALIGAAFGSSGERCMAISVAVAVGSETADNLIAGLKSKMHDLKVGNFDNSKNDFGPLITKDHMKKVKKYITSAEAQGADIVVDGRSVTVKGCENGFYVGGTLIDNVKASMESYKNEIFGPVLQVVRVETMQQAIDLIDEHPRWRSSEIF
jgi:malonate-semialdehyde dehydrogenase (acetylating)/methylmalonate-semialdehyde dehydrogenase